MAMSFDEADRISAGTLLTEWVAQIAAGHLTDAGLVEVRRRIRAGECDAQPWARAVLVLCVEALLLGRGWPASAWPVLGEVLPPMPEDASELSYGAA